jgi:hypothetical protein
VIVLLGIAGTRSVKKWLDGAGESGWDHEMNQAGAELEASSKDKERDSLEDDVEDCVEDQTEDCIEEDIGKKELHQDRNQYQEGSFRSSVAVLVALSVSSLLASSATASKVSLTDGPEPLQTVPQQASMLAMFKHIVFSQLRR